MCDHKVVTSSTLDSSVQAQNQHQAYNQVHDNLSNGASAADLSLANSVALHNEEGHGCNSMHLPGDVQSQLEARPSCWEEWAVSVCEMTSFKQH